MCVCMCVQLAYRALWKECRALAYGAYRWLYDDVVGVVVIATDYPGYNATDVPGYIMMSRGSCI